jgi:hypothetical protein
MAQEYVSTQELMEIRVGGTRVFQLKDPKKMQSVASMCTRLKNEGRGDWTVRKDYESTSVSITRNK